MKKLFIVLLAIVVISALIFGGCAEPAPAPAPAPTPAPSPAPTPAPSPAPTPTPSPAPTPAPSPAPAPVKPITIKVGHDLPPFANPAVGIGAWADMVTERTKGRVVVDVYPASSLSSQQNAIENLHAGVLDVYMVSISVHRHLFPAHAVIGLPGLGFPDTIEGQQAHVNAYMALLDKYPVMNEEIKDFKIIYHIVYSGAYLLTRDKKVVVPDDCQGLKIGGSGVTMELAAVAGAAPVFDIPPLAYEKLQTGVIDGTHAALAAAYDFKLKEVTKYVLDLQMAQSGIPLWMSRATWDKISPGDQQIMLEAGIEGQRIGHEAAAEDTELGIQDFAQYDDNEVIEPTMAQRGLWEEKFAILWNQWIADCKAEGITDAEAIFNDWKSAAYKAWGR